MKKYFLSFKHAQEGLAFLEFALCAPFLLLLLLGSIEVTRYILIYQKTEKAAFSIADIVAQGKTITNTDLNNITTAATQIMKPFTFGPNGYVIISSVTRYGSSNPTINWQYTSSGNNGSWTHASKIGYAGLAATLPGGLTLNDKDNIIIAEIYYNFQPLIGTDGILPNSIIYTAKVYKTRLGALGSISPG